MITGIENRMPFLICVLVTTLETLRKTFGTWQSFCCVLKVKALCWISGLHWPPDVNRQGYYRRIVALEPDESRWIVCHREHHLPPQYEVLCQTTTEYSTNPEKEFDLIVIAMVLQHLATTDCEKLLEEMATLLKPDGIVLIFTTHTLEETKGFSFSGHPDKYVSEQTFNDYANSPSSDKTKGIPVRRFSRNELQDRVSRYLDPIYWRQCSYYNEHGVHFFAPILKVEAQKLKNIGRSQFVVARKRS